MTLRRHLQELLSHEPRSVCRWRGSWACAVTTSKRTCSTARSAAARGDRIEILPARCKACGFEFGPDRLAEPSRCPSCKASRIHEAMIRIA